MSQYQLSHSELEAMSYVHASGPVGRRAKTKWKSHLAYLLRRDHIRCVLAPPRSLVAIVAVGVEDILLLVPIFDTKHKTQVTL